MIWSMAMAASLESAAEAVASGDYAAAEAAYAEAVAGGAVSADLYYNLGNVLYRQDRVADAILAWRRAAVLAPRDPDVSANLEFARRKVTDDLVASDPCPAWAPWQAALTAGEGQWLGGALAGLGLCAVAFRRRWSHLPLAGVGGVATVLGLLVATGGAVEATMPPAAVVLAAEVTARSDLAGGVDLFVLHAGAEVGVAEAAAGQVLVSLPDGRRGWVAESAVGRVDPHALRR